MKVIRIMKVIRRYIGKSAAVTLAAFLSFMTTGCVKRDLEEMPGEGYVSVKVDWAGSGSPSADHTVKLLFYDADGKLFRTVDNVSTNYEGSFPTGEYSIVCYNEDMKNSDWRNHDSFSTAETFAVPKEFEFDHRPSQFRCVAAPSEVYVANVFQESEKMQVNDIENVSVTVTPVDRLHHLRLRFHVSVAGEEEIESLGGVLGGVSGSWLVSTGSNDTSLPLAHEFRASVATKAGGSAYEWEAPLYIFGLIAPGSSEWSHPLYLTLQIKDGAKLTAAFDLTPTVRDIFAREGALPGNIPVEVKVHVSKTGLSANVIPWDESGAGNGSPRPQK